MWSVPLYCLARLFRGSKEWSRARNPVRTQEKLTRLAVYSPNVAVCLPVAASSNRYTKLLHPRNSQRYGYTIYRIPPATHASTKSDAALGGAPGSKELAQIKANNQHTELDQAMPVCTPQ